MVAYTDVGGRQCLEHIVEQLPVHNYLPIYLFLLDHQDDVYETQVTELSVDLNSIFVFVFKILLACIAH